MRHQSRREPMQARTIYRRLCWMLNEVRRGRGRFDKKVRESEIAVEEAKRVLRLDPPKE